MSADPLGDLFDSTVGMERFRHALIAVGQSTGPLNAALLRMRDASVRLMAEVAEAIIRQEYGFTGAPPYGGTWSRRQMVAR